MSRLVLVISTDREQNEAFRGLDLGDIEISTVNSWDEGLRPFGGEKPDVVLLDLSHISDTETITKIVSNDPKVPVICISAAQTSELTITAMKLGAYDYLLKPLDCEKVLTLVRQALDIRYSMCVPVRMPEGHLDDSELADAFVGRCPAMQEVYKAIGRVAPYNMTVLIRGETGTGKELVARAIYHHSPRSHARFLAVNMAAVPDTLLESELFGHEKGSFTGAENRRIGRFEQSSGGTLFLDEIGDLSPVVQSKLLRLLQEQRFERVGGSETIKTDVRVIAATNRDLEKMVDEGDFRADLYYRLNGYTVNLPPLAERGDDLLLLLEHFLAEFSRKLGKDVQGISPDAIVLLRKYPWKGNVRELQSVVQKSLLHVTGQVLMPDFLPLEVRNSGRQKVAAISQQHMVQTNRTSTGKKVAKQRATKLADSKVLDALLGMLTDFVVNGRAIDDKSCSESFREAVECHIADTFNPNDHRAPVRCLVAALKRLLDGDATEKGLADRFGKSLPIVYLNWLWSVDDGRGNILVDGMLPPPRARRHPQPETPFHPGQNIQPNRKEFLITRMAARGGVEPGAVERVEVIRILDNKLKSCQKAVVTLHGPPGVGKSTNVFQWRESHRADNWLRDGSPSIPFWFEWSFFDKKSNPQDNSLFLRCIEKFFDDKLHYPVAPAQTEKERGKAVARAFNKVGGVLVLDGIEAVQGVDGDGCIYDDGVRSLIKEFMVTSPPPADRLPRVLVITTQRLPIHWPQDCVSETIQIDGFTPEEGESFLRAFWMQSPHGILRIQCRLRDEALAEEYQQASKDDGGIPLALLLTASALCLTGTDLEDRKNLKIPTDSRGETP